MFSRVPQKNGLVREKTHSLLCHGRIKAWEIDTISWAIFIGGYWMKAWMKVFFATIAEVGWVIGLAHADTAIEWILTILAIVICNYFLLKAQRELPTGTVYAVFVGLGTAGAVISEILFFGEPFKILKILFIGLLLIGVISLKLVTDQENGDSKNHQQKEVG